MESRAERFREAVERVECLEDGDQVLAESVGELVDVVRLLSETDVPRLDVDVYRSKVFGPTYRMRLELEEEEQ